MKVLVIGAGMYVTGRQDTGPGTVLSSLAQASKVLPIEEVTVVATNTSNAAAVTEAVARINATIGTALKVRYRNIAGDAATDIPTLCSETRYGCAVVSVPDHLHFAYASALLYQGVHYVDLIWFLTGFLPVRAMAVGTDGTLREQGIATWDSVHATVIWRHRADADWFVSQFATNWIDPECTSAMSDQRYKVIGTRGRIECDQKNRGLELVHQDFGIEQINPYFSEYLPGVDGRLAYRGYGHESISQFIRDVLDIAAGRTSPAMLESSRPTLRQSLVSTAVIEAVNLSLAEHSAWKDIRDPF